MSTAGAAILVLYGIVPTYQANGVSATTPDAETARSKSSSGGLTAPRIGGH